MNEQQISVIETEISHLVNERQSLAREMSRITEAIEASNQNLGLCSQQYQGLNSRIESLQSLLKPVDTVQHFTEASADEQDSAPQSSPRKLASRRKRETG